LKNLACFLFQNGRKTKTCFLPHFLWQNSLNLLKNAVMFRQTVYVRLILCVAAWGFLLEQVCAQISLKANLPNANSILLAEKNHEELMRQTAAKGTRDAFHVCAKLLESASKEDQLKLVGALDLGIEEARNNKTILEFEFPESLKAQLLALWKDDTLDPALIRVLARSGYAPAYKRAAFVAKEYGSPNSVRINMVHLLSESRRPDALEGLFQVIGPIQPDVVKVAAFDGLRNFEGEQIAIRLLTFYRTLPERLRYQMREVLLRACT
jgi:hypothetical protein